MTGIDILDHEYYRCRYALSTNTRWILDWLSTDTRLRHPRVHVMQYFRRTAPLKLIEQTRVASQIARCAKSPQFHATVADQDQSSLSNLRQWQGVAAASEEEPHVVMEFLLSIQQFDLAAEWAELHVLPKHFHKVRDKAGEIL